jgi:hypothetical protein
MNNTLKLGDRLFTGAIVSSQTSCDAYNALTQEIAKREAQGLSTEQQRNGRHNLFIAMAYTK